MHFLTPFNFFASTNICQVSFFIDAGKISLRGIISYTTFLYFFKMFITVSSFISIWIGFKPPTTSKFCCALIITDSIGADIIPFFLFPSFVIEKWWTFLSLVFTSEPCICFSWNVKSVLQVFFSMKNFKKL